MSQPDKFSVIASDELLPPRAKVASVYEDFYGISYDEAVVAARHSWGIIAENLEQEQAEKLAAKCFADGINVFTAQGQSLPRLPQEIVITKADCSGDKFSFTPHEGLPRTLQWDEIAALSAAPVKEETVTTGTGLEAPSEGKQAMGIVLTVATGLPIFGGLKPKQVQKEIRRTETFFALDIILRGSWERLRLRSDSFDYSYLKERKTYSSQTNFRILAADAGNRATKALKNAGLLAILNMQPLAGLGYDATADFNKETGRLFILASRATQ